MKKALITGANKSIGFEVARQLLQKGFYVYLGTRSLDNGKEAVDKLRSEGLTNVEPVVIDVASSDSVKAARVEIGKKTDVLDVLINNAGINGLTKDADGSIVPQTATGTDVSVFQKVYETNVYGVIRVTQSFIDLMRRSPEPRIVNVSSSQGSITLSGDPTYKYYLHKGAAYHSSKSALNMYGVQLAFELRDTPFKVNMVDPGFIKTDFNYRRGTGTVEDAARRIIKYALIGQDGPTGKYFSEEYNPETGAIPW